MPNDLLNDLLTANVQTDCHQAIDAEEEQWEDHPKFRCSERSQFANLWLAAWVQHVFRLQHTCISRHMMHETCKSQASQDRKHDSNTHTHETEITIPLVHVWDSKLISDSRWNAVVYLLRPGCRWRACCNASFRRIQCGVGWRCRLLQAFDMTMFGSAPLNVMTSQSKDTTATHSSRNWLEFCSRKAQHRQLPVTS